MCIPVSFGTIFSVLLFHYCLLNFVHLLNIVTVRPFCYVAFPIMDLITLLFQTTSMLSNILLDTLKPDIIITLHKYKLLNFGILLVIIKCLPLPCYEINQDYFLPQCLFPKNNSIYEYPSE